MYNFEELEERYTAQPRKMDAYLRPMTYTDTGDSLPFPTIKLTIATLVTAGLSYWAMEHFQTSLHVVALIGSTILLGIGIQIVRSASVSERNSRLIQEAPLVYGRVIQGAPNLYREGSENGSASVVFTRDEGRRRDTFYLKEVAKKLRAAIEGDDLSPELTAASEIVKSTTGRAVRLPENVGSDGDSWVAVIQVNPERLPENKIVKQHVLLLVAPEANLVAQL